MKKSYKKLLNTICIILAITAVCLPSAASFASAASGAAGQPHFYATSLLEFGRTLTGRFTSFLYDIDGCGSDEVIAFGTKAIEDGEWTSDDKLAVFDAKNDGNTISTVFFSDYDINEFNMYVTGNNYIIRHNLYEDERHMVYKYENRVLSKVADLLYGVTYDEENDYAGRDIYLIDNIECNQSQYEAALKKYGADDAVMMIAYAEMFADSDRVKNTPFRNENTAIIEMVNSSGTPSVTPGKTSGGTPGGTSSVTLGETSGGTPDVGDGKVYTAAPTTSDIQLNGAALTFISYNIEDYNYFKLRDLAFILSGTSAQFEVGWNETSSTITITKGAPYTPAGGEMAARGTAAKYATPTLSSTLIDGNSVDFTAYNIDDNNYFKLRDIGNAIGFIVDWEEATDTINIITGD